MKRSYKTGQAEDVKMFVGQEVEKTPAFGLKTFFLVGPPQLEDDKELEKNLNIAKINGCNHVYLGANQSFCPEDQSQLQPWDDLAAFFLNNGFWVTLDFDVDFLPMVQSMSVSSHHKFIPQISIKIPNINLMNYNTTIKIDDIGFAKTNPGVWCYLLSDLKARSNFTDWSKYSEDKII